MLQVCVFGAGQLGNGVCAALRAGRRYQVLGPYKRQERDVALTSGADVVIIATTTRFRDVAADIEVAVRAGSDVLVSAEECAYPYAVDPGLAQRLHLLALKRGVSIAGSGVNPGLVFDSLVLTLLGAAPNDCQIEVRRTVDLSRFGAAVLRRIGLGLNAAAFAKAALREEILGHAGFPQSMHIVAAATGLTLQRISKELLPIVTDRPIELPGRMSIAPGESAGVNQLYTAFVDNRPWFTCRFLGHVALDDIDRSSGDDIELRRDGTILHTMQIRPGIPAQAGSQNMVVNSIERIVAASPGWHTVADLPPAHPFTLCTSTA